MEFKVEVPGTYILVDHALFRTFNKGALAMLKVDGPDNTLVYSGKEVDAIYLGEHAPEGHAAAQRIATLEKQVEETIKQTPALATITKELQMEKGKLVFMQTCAVCHQTQGQGLPAATRRACRSATASAAVVGCATGSLRLGPSPTGVPGRS